MTDQSGSAKAALNIIDYNLDIYYIKEGEIKNYVYSLDGATSGTWVRQTDMVRVSGTWTIVVTSGSELWCDVSGDPVRIYDYAADSSTKIAALVRAQNMSGTEPIVFDWAADSSTKIAARVRPINLSGTEPIIFDWAADSSTKIAVRARAINMSGTEPIIFDWASDSSTKIPAQVRVTNLSGTEPIFIRDFTDISAYLATGTAALNMTYFLAKTATRLESVYVHLTSAPTISSELYLNITPGVVSGTAAYVNKCLSENPYITASQNYLYIPDQPLALQSGDYLNLYYSNPCGASGLAYGVRMIFGQERA